MRNFVYYSVDASRATWRESRCVTLELYRQVVLIWKVHMGFVWRLPRYCNTFSRKIKNIRGDCNFCVPEVAFCSWLGASNVQEEVADQNQPGRVYFWCIMFKHVVCLIN
jgi:hypothetical protein